VSDEPGYESEDQPITEEEDEIEILDGPKGRVPQMDATFDNFNTILQPGGLLSLDSKLNKPTSMVNPAIAEVLK
jgi:hypothetical protein